MSTPITEALARLAAETDRAEAVLARRSPKRLPVRPSSGSGRRTPEATASTIHTFKENTP